jgi:hypothetical protein
MRKLAAALAAVGIAALSAMTLAPQPAIAQGKPKAAPAAVAKKKVVRKKAPAKVALVKYQRKCKPGWKWNASASINAGACQRVAY